MNSLVSGKRAALRDPDPLSTTGGSLCACACKINIIILDFEALVLNFSLQCSTVLTMVLIYSFSAMEHFSYAPPEIFISIIK